MLLSSKTFLDLIKTCFDCILDVFKTIMEPRRVLFVLKIPDSDVQRSEAKRKEEQLLALVKESLTYYEDRSHKNTPHALELSDF